MRKRTLFIIIGVVLVLVIGICLLCVFLSKRDTSYVAKNKIKVLDINNVERIGVFYYTLDENNKEKEYGGVDFEEGKASYKFYDKKIEEEKDGDVIYTFKYDIEVPLQVYSVVHTENWFYVYDVNFPMFFDYYTGTVIKPKQTSEGDLILMYNDITSKDEDDEYRYTTVTWKKKSCKVGINVVIDAKWDGTKVTNIEENKVTYNDTARITATVKVKAPKKYDGLMIAIYNVTPNEKYHEIKFNEYNKYIELKAEAEETGEKSRELLNIEQKVNRIYKLLEYGFDGIDYTKDDYNVYRVSDLS